MINNQLLVSALKIYNGEVLYYIDGQNAEYTNFAENEPHPLYKVQRTRAIFVPLTSDINIAAG